MILDIHQLQESNHDIFRQFGWFFYDKDIEKGLNKEDAMKLIEMLVDSEKRLDIIIEDEVVRAINEYEF